MHRAGSSLALALCTAFFAAASFADGPVVDAAGAKWICSDGICRMVDGAVAPPDEPGDGLADLKPARTTLGYQDAETFLSFLAPGEPAAAAPHEAFVSFSAWTLLLVLLGGLALNLTPCVLPMIPVNLIVIGKSSARGLVYGLGMALSYGTLGVFAAIGALAFGAIQSLAAFNVFVAVVFAVLALSLMGWLPIDLTRFRPAGTRLNGAGTLFAVFALGALSALLAGACVAPVLISVLVLTARLYAAGNFAALALPFVLGAGMALPWPFLGAGLRVLPKPGRWMNAVNGLFALVLLGFAVWHVRLALSAARGARAAAADAIPGAIDATPATFASAYASARAAGRPVLVDCWASWCKNCTAMERKTLADARVRTALQNFSVVRLNAEDINALRTLEPFKDVPGLPAFAVFNDPPAQ